MNYVFATNRADAKVVLLPKDNSVRRDGTGAYAQVIEATVRTRQRC